MARDYDSSPVSDALGLRDVIQGLVSDINALREGKISPQDAMARAQIAKQVFNGVRLYVQAARYIGEQAVPVPSLEGEDVQ